MHSSRPFINNNIVNDCYYSSSRDRIFAPSLSVLTFQLTVDDIESVYHLQSSSSTPSQWIISVGSLCLWLCLITVYCYSRYILLYTSLYTPSNIFIYMISPFLYRMRSTIWSHQRNGKEQTLTINYDDGHRLLRSNKWSLSLTYLLTYPFSLCQLLELSSRTVPILCSLSSKLSRWSLTGSLIPTLDSEL